MSPKVSKAYKEEKKAIILEGALHCFTEKGFQATTIDGIGAPAPKDLSAGDVTTNAPKDVGYGALEVLVAVLVVVILVLVILRLA